MPAESCVRVADPLRSCKGGDSQEQPHVWQRRFYDFNVWSERKRVEKLRYMHRNPVKDGLVAEPEDWEWSSYRSYAFQEEGIVKINQWPKAVMKVRTKPSGKPKGWAVWNTHPLQRTQRMGHPEEKAKSRVAGPFAPFAKGCGIPELAHKRILTCLH